MFKDDTLEGGSDDDASGENRNWSRLVCHFSVKDFPKCESLTRSGEHVKEEDFVRIPRVLPTTVKCKVQCLLEWFSREKNFYISSVLFIKKILLTHTTP